MPRYPAGSGKRPRKQPAPPSPSLAATSLDAFLALRYFTAPRDELTETDCKEASRENARLLAMGLIDAKQAEAFDKMIRTTLACIGREFQTREFRGLEEMERRAEARERTAQAREAKARQRRDE